jgi:hypothetical protein
VVRQALRNPRLRRVLAAYLIFNVAEWASWIALLVWAYDLGGVQGSSAIAIVQLVPGALLATPAATLFAGLSRARALAVSYTFQAVCYMALGAALVLDASTWLVAGVAALASVAVTLTRPAVLPDGVAVQLAVLRQQAVCTAEAFPRLHQMRGLDEYWVEINRLENQADEAYRVMIAELFSGAYEALELLKVKEVVDALESAADAFETVSHHVETIVVKES